MNDSTEIEKEDALINKKEQKGFVRWAVIIFILTLLNYGFLHSSREGWAMSKRSIANQGGPSIKQIGLIDTLFLLGNGIGLFIMGNLGDRLNFKIIIIIGLLSSGVLFSLIGICGWINIQSPWPFAVIMFVCGMTQATGWPCNVGVMGNWTKKNVLGTVMGVWSLSGNLGNIIGVQLAGLLLGVFTDNTREKPVQWEYVILIMSAILFVWALVNIFVMVENPIKKGYHVETKNSSKRLEVEKTETESNEKPISICKAFLIPGLVLYCLAFFFMKLVNYSIMFWMPLYINDGLGNTPHVAANIQTCYDIGSMIGGIIIGFLSDKIGKRYNIN
jgi:sugar phosphate permease